MLLAAVAPPVGGHALWLAGGTVSLHAGYGYHRGLHHDYSLAPSVMEALRQHLDLTHHSWVDRFANACNAVCPRFARVSRQMRARVRQPAVLVGASSGGAGEELGFPAGPALTSRGGQAADGMLRLRADRSAVALSALVPSSRGVCISASSAFHACAAEQCCGRTLSSPRTVPSSSMCQWWLCTSCPDNVSERLCAVLR